MFKLKYSEAEKLQAVSDDLYWEYRQAKANYERAQEETNEAWEQVNE
jgi:hypothetical protein